VAHFRSLPPVYDSAIQRAKTSHVSLGREARRSYALGSMIKPDAAGLSERSDWQSVVCHTLS